MLATGYVLRGQAIKGRYLIRMRRNITQGLLRGMPPAERTHDPCRPHDRGERSENIRSEPETETDTAESPCKRIRMISVSDGLISPHKRTKKEKNTYENARCSADSRILSLTRTHGTGTIGRPPCDMFPIPEPKISQSVGTETAIRFRTTQPRKTERTGAEKRPESRSGSDVPPGIRLPNSQTHHAMSDRKHILIVSNACYPELSPRAFRTTELVRELVRRGHRVTLLLPNRETYRRNPLTGDGLQIVYSSSRLEPEKGTPTARRNRKIRSLLPKFAQRAVLYFYCHELRAKYDPGLCERLSELSGPFDAVLSISYPAAVHLAVSRAMRRNAALRSAVTIAEFSDPPFRGDVARTVFPAYFLYLKRWARQFDYFTIPVEKALPCYTPYIDRDRVRIIPQGFDLSTVRRLPYTPHAKPRIRLCRPLLRAHPRPEVLFRLSRDARYGFPVRPVRQLSRSLLPAK